MLLTKEVEVKLHGRNIKYYNELGYDGKNNDIITVRIEDLQLGSNAIVDVLCDYCKDNILQMTYKYYNQRIKKYGNCSCIKCQPIKAKESNMKKYGVPSPICTDEIKEKIKKNNIEKYGVPCTLQDEKVKQKALETLYVHYGVDNPMKNEFVKEKRIKTNMSKYKTKYPMQNIEIKNKTAGTNLLRYGYNGCIGYKNICEKRKQTMLERYGVENPHDIPEVREKISNTLYQNQSQKTSLQQRYIGALYGGELNYPIKYYNVDICLHNDSVVIEYDGGGHMLNVMTGRETLDEYNQKTIIRDKIIKHEGYKQIRIVSSKDYLPSDEILLQMLEQAKEYFNTTNHTWVEYNIDSSIMRNAEHKEGVFFDFGELRKLKRVS